MKIEEKIIQFLTYKKRPNLAQLISGTEYELNETSTYGSRWFSRLTSVALYAPIQKYEILQKLSKEDKNEIIGAFHIVYPVRENDIEINHIEFFINASAPIPLSGVNMNRLQQIDFIYINEQISKCDSKISSGDFEGAITNARNLLESICRYILDNSGEKYNPKADLPELFKATSSFLNMHPTQHIEKSFKQILSGCFSIVQGFTSIRNDLSDAHGKSANNYYKPKERHAVFAVGSAQILSNFIYSSYEDNLKSKK
ncbi:MAG: hypothetical protein UT30_C0045G0004 [Candidatus Uhrbacteria bacterium GW2011_GWF2_39_13]|uniref:Abortive infection protein-like C-terminal domain-containing protein n=1 Tax=Candidatus Uhrbacteria bacterium GW2011_GWF2_39_13 TaxID=1618995 RepID=A0A0G0QMH6_9BACT|nr:MAG: hypothetical protein UT30_C0045G0004 [Candidatus Uhrbacteria bacterium GW2011_GWF2_39_13]